MQPDGRLVLAISGIGEPPTRVARLLADGSHDRSFAIFTGFDLSAPVVQPVGRIVMAGSLSPIPKEPGVDRFVQRFRLSRLLGGTPPGRIAGDAGAVVRRGRARLRLACGPRGAALCSGAVTITSVRSGARPGPRVTFGRGSFSLAADRTAVVRVVLNSAGLRRLKRANGRLDVRVTPTNSGRSSTARRVRLARG